MVVIRLARGGSKKRPFYSVVATDKRSSRDGRYIERLGFYNPSGEAGPNDLRIDLERVQYWVGVGAQVSPTVQRLVKKAEFNLTAPAEAAKPVAKKAEKTEKVEKVEEPKAEETEETSEEASAE